MINFIRRRLLITLPILLGVSTLTFLLIHFVPGDPIDIMLGDQATLSDKTNLRQELGLDQPLLVQYGKFLKGLITLDLGVSLQSKRPVYQEISERIPATIELTFGALIIALLIGIPLGVMAAIKQYSWLDNSILITSLTGLSVPSFWLGPMLIYIFAIRLDLLPVSERGGLANLILPAITLAIHMSAILIRMTRASMLEVIKEEYITVARAKGVGFFSLYFKHALANALIPIITIVGLQFGSLLAGAVITETIFDWPGVGTLLLSSIQQRNYPLVQGCVLFISVSYVVVNLLTDIAYSLANPKVRIS